jgi:hypothetical protein
VLGSIKGCLRISVEWFRTPKFIRGQLGILSRLPLSARVFNGAVCLVLLAMYFVEGWVFGWRDPFALLLVPAFVLATLE